MAVKKVPISRERFEEAKKLRGSSIRKLGAVKGGIGCDEKTIRRGLNDGEVTVEVMDLLARGLDIDPHYLSGKYHADAEACPIPEVRAALLRELCPERYPYLFVQKRDRSDGRYLYDRYLENILVIHNISRAQFEALPFEQQKKLQVELEGAICQVLLRYFDKDATGENTYPEIYHLQNDIEEYDPDYKEPPEDFFREMSEYEDRFSETSGSKE